MDYQQWFNTMEQYLKNPTDIQKQLDSLNQVKEWLEINTNMVKNTIQYLEFYQNLYSNTSLNNQNNESTDNFANLDFGKMSSDWLIQIQKMQNNIWNSNNMPKDQG